MSSMKIAHFVPIDQPTWPPHTILVSDWSISKKSSPLKLLSHMNRNLVGSIYMYGRFCIKFPQSKMKGERHRLSSLSLQLNGQKTCVQQLNALFNMIISLDEKRYYRSASCMFMWLVPLLSSRGSLDHDHESWIYNYLCNQCLSPLMTQ